MSEEAQASKGYQLQISYSFDGETTPSVAFNPAEAMGQMHGAVQLGGEARGQWHVLVAGEERDERPAAARRHLEN